MMLVRTEAGVETMKCPLWLYQLLAVAPLRTVKIGPEDRISIDLANRVRAHAMNGRFNGVFTHIPHEVGGGRGRGSELRYALAKMMGLVPGSGDWVFTRKDASLWIELKRPKLTKAEHGRRDSGGRLGPDQEKFQMWAAREAVPYHVCTSADEAEALLRSHGFILEG